MPFVRLFAVGLALLATFSTAAADTPDLALRRLLDAARAECGGPAADALTRVLCSGALRVGVRSSYPLFAQGRGDQRTGYDVDVARAIAARLGVAPTWVDVRAATRISTLAEGGADLVVATMGHTTRRDAEARFIRPHYYRSETIVVGSRETAVEGWGDLAGRALCATIGNYANAQIVSQNVRLMLFEDAGRLPEALRGGSCLLAAQDDSFFASFLADSEAGSRFERKFGFDAVPWGMAVAPSDSGRLAAALDLISEIMHRDGTFLAIARAHRVPTAFLEEQQALWRTPACAEAVAPACLLPPLDATPAPTRFAGRVDAAVALLQRTFGTSPELPMLTSVPAWELFQAGVFNSLVLVFGTIAATLAFALLFGRASASRWRGVRILAWAAITTIQSSPVVLTLVVASAVAQALFTYSAAVAIGAAIVALGLMNGCNAGQAIGEAAASLRREAADAATTPSFRAAIGRSLTQILSFLVNAAKGTPIASFTGAPELLSALTDITSFAAGRVTTYTLVLLFYIGVVVTIVAVSDRTRAWLERTRVLA